MCGLRAGLESMKINTFDPSCNRRHGMAKALEWACLMALAYAASGLFNPLQAASSYARYRRAVTLSPDVFLH
jgi:hypothetical protein